MTSAPSTGLRAASTQIGPVIRRRAALAGAITALAIAAPVGAASAATPPTAPTPTSAADTATGPVLVGDVFNGNTAIVTSPSSAVATVVGGR
jgi:hypothetical protein